MQVVLRFLGPLCLAVVVGFELASRGYLTAAVGAYLTALAAEAVVRLWGRYRLHRAKERLAALRAARR